MASITKKLINSPESAVDDSLLGLCYAHPGLKLLKGHRVVFRSDYAELKKKGQVALMSGGGSGHEPAHAGYVGPGMLTAAVAGAVFTSPPPSDCLSAIRLIGLNNPGGVLIIVKNYTGDRLNFGFAAEKAKMEGIKVEMVMVGDDCALKSEDKTAGRRGLCGTLLVHKMAGAMADASKSLESIVASLKTAMTGLATIGLSLSPCSLPGQRPNFQLGSDEIELGLGIHGEAGVKRMKLVSAKETVQIMVDQLGLMKKSDSVLMSPGARVAVVVNNLGGTSCLEMNIVIKELMSLLRSMDVVVERLFSGSLMTALEMAGVSITVLKVNDDFLQMLDHPTTAPAWPRVFSGGFWFSHTADHIITPPECNEEISSKSSAASLSSLAHLDEHGERLVVKAIQQICKVLMDNEAILNTLDSESGDGDCGNTHSRFAKAVLDSQHLTFRCPANLLHQLSIVAQEAMGGSSGAVYSLGLVAGSSCLENEISIKSWSAALQTGMEAITFYGQAEVGDRTLLDALNPVLLSLRAEPEGASAKEAVVRAAKAAVDGAEATKVMVAKAGRASYVRREKQRHPDPGAFAVGLWMSAVADAMQVQRCGCGTVAKQS